MTDQSHDLFGAPPAEPPSPPHFMTLAARRKLGQGEDWHWCKARRIGDTDDLLIEGGIPRLYTKGKHKGGRNWKGVPLTECVVTRADQDEEARLYEQVTGNCRGCGGGGQEWAGWHYEKGNSYRICTRCKGAGKPAANHTGEMRGNQ